MSLWCKKCQTRIYDNEKCPKCGHSEETKTYKIKENKKVRILKKEKYKEETITLNKNTIFLTAIIIIAISISYLAYNKYEENRQIGKVAKMYYGTEDPDEIIEKMKEQKKQYENLLKKITHN